MSLAQRITRWWYTLSPLRPVQWTNRIYRKWHRLRVDTPARVSVRPQPTAWMPPVARPQSLVGPQELRVFETVHEVAAPEDWNRSDRSHLVRYNLHYFEDLQAADGASRQAWHQDLVQRWIRENPPCHGAGWEPYPLSLRIVNWIKWHWQFGSLDERSLQSLAMQVSALEQQLEFHLLANHLLANAKALVFAGAFFEGPDAERWLRRGSRLLAREVREQILPDGGHYELSPMYHSIIWEDLLDVWNLYRSGDWPSLAWVADLPPVLERMGAWLAAMCHPDGRIGFFNDAAWGVAAEPSELHDYAVRLGLNRATAPREGLLHLPDSGYVRAAAGDFLTILDIAPVRPAYQPGHTHADLLSQEISWRGQRIVVNSGTSEYGLSAERMRQRSTAAHSTVEVDHRNSSDVWSGFRVGRRARPLDLAIGREADEHWVACSHDGYRAGRGGTLHRRTWRISPRGITVEDQLPGTWRQAVSRFYLDPAVGCTQSPTGEFRLTAPGGLLSAGGGPSAWEVAASTYHPRFEVAEANSCLAARWTEQAQSWRLAAETCVDSRSS